MNAIKAIVIGAPLFFFTVSGSALPMRVYSPPGFDAISADGTFFGDFGPDYWFFDIGTFDKGFSPGPGNWAEWEANWNQLSTARWLVDTGFPPIDNRIDHSFHQNDDDFSQKPGFVWAYNSKKMDAGAEWVLITNDHWVFPNPNPFALTIEWNIADGGNVTVGFGQFFGQNGEFSGMQTEVVPEPSAYALLLGLGLLSFVGVRSCLLVTKPPPARVELIK